MNNTGSGGGGEVAIVHDKSLDALGTEVKEFVMSHPNSLIP